MTTQCSATSKKTGRRCPKAPMAGATTCFTHGPREAVREAATRGALVLSRQRATKTLAKASAAAVEVLDGLPTPQLNSIAGITTFLTNTAVLLAQRQLAPSSAAVLVRLGEVALKSLDVAAGVSLLEIAEERAAALRAKGWR